MVVRTDRSSAAIPADAIPADAIPEAAARVSLFSCFGNSVSKKYDPMHTRTYHAPTPKPDPHNRTKKKDARYITHTQP